MSSLIHGFQYDIFISYRHNDNRSGWVTDFVKAIQEELAATIKDPVSVYFDSSPHDGLLETHNVDKSLEAKLKCLILIPIISQTYCDTKSFAWKYEFCAFNKLVTKDDQFGRNIKLSNGNVASRILPIKIHALDPEDTALLENELGGPLRAIEFIFRSAGVNRPLSAHEDHPHDNLNKTFYRDQVNKVANAAKDILSALKNPLDQPQSNVTTPHLSREEPKRRRYVIAIVCSIVLMAGAYFLYPKFFQTNDAIELDKSIAVLPFVNMSDNADQEYFSDGITEDITTQLSKISNLQVSSRAASSRYKKTSETPKEIAAALNVNYLLDGTVRLADGRVIITANLIDAASEKQLWAEKYDRELNEIFRVQADVAEQIASAMRISLSEQERNFVELKPTDNMEAYQLYLRGRYHYSRNSDEDANMALRLFTQAQSIDPDYALALVGLSQCYSQFAYYQYPLMHPHEAFLKAKETALKAMQIDPNLSEAHAALAYVLRTYEWDWDGAKQEYLKSLDLNPRNALAHDHMALLYSALGEFDLAMKYAKSAAELDLLNVNTLLDEARVYNYAGRIELAIDKTRQALELDRNFSMFHGMLAALHEQKGNFDSALVEFKKSRSRTGLDYEGISEGFVPIEASDYQDYWKKNLEQAIADSKEKPVSNFVMAVLYIKVGDKENALRNLETAYQEKEGPMVYVNVEPIFKPLLQEPRFKKIVTSMGLRK